MKLHIATVTIVALLISTSAMADWWDGWNNGSGSGQGYGTAQGNTSGSGNVAGDYRGSGQGWGTGKGDADGEVDFSISFKGKGRTNMDTAGNLQGNSSGSGNTAGNWSGQGNTSGNFQGDGYGQGDNSSYGGFPRSGYRGYGSNMPWGNSGGYGFAPSPYSPAITSGNRPSYQELQAQLVAQRKQYEAYIKQLMEQQRRAQMNTNQKGQTKVPATPIK